VLQDRGFKVALVTDGRMSGASGKVPAAIHVTPEAAERGALARLQDGDVIRLDAREGRLDALVDEAEWTWRTAVEPDLSRHAQGVGRELFGNFRSQVTSAELGAAAVTFLPEPHVYTRADADARF
jgi:phosphogluconate dehydratase